MDFFFFFLAERLVQISQIITRLILSSSQVLDPRSVGSGNTVFTAAMAHVSAAETFNIYSMSDENTLKKNKPTVGYSEEKRDFCTFAC